jgi:integrase
MACELDNSKATTEWLNSKGKGTRIQYQNRWDNWISYCKSRGLLTTGSEQLEDIKKRRTSTDNTVKFFYDNEVPKLFKWLTTEFKGQRTKKPLGENAALAVTTAVRSFFKYYRYPLIIQSDALPSSEKTKSVFTDHAFDIHQLRDMFNQGDLQERTILSCGKDLWLRVGDFAKLNRELVELTIKREEETAKKESRDAGIIEFELVTEKEKEPASCHLSIESIELVKEYLRTYPKTNGHLFPFAAEDSYNDLLRRLADKAKITLTGRVRWHCLRKFGITIMHGKVTEPVMKYMTGKHIAKELRTYIQNNREPYKAFKTIQPLITLTKSSGSNGNVKQLEMIQEQGAKLVATLKLIEKTTPKEVMEKAIIDLAEDYGIELEVKTETPKEGMGFIIAKPIAPPLEEFIPKLMEAIQKRELEKELEENNE